eukprot:m51a1_g8485 hypothetical protein (176) ;mRNA; r:534752-535358
MAANAKTEWPQSDAPYGICFDLDYTLWPFWVDTHVSPPFRSRGKHCAVDSVGMEISLYRDVLGILEEIKERGIPLCAASRTEAPSDARKLLAVLGIERYFAAVFIDSGPKTWHLAQAAKHCGLPFERMILFDDENRNIGDVTRAGAGAVQVNDRCGLTRKVFLDGLRRWLDSKQN